MPPGALKNDGGDCVVALVTCIGRFIVVRNNYSRRAARLEWIGHRDAAPFVRDAVVGHPVARDGYLELPTAPGLGVELDLAVIAAHPYQPFAWNLFGEGWERRFERG